jgi:hypothetical protein
MPMKCTVTISYLVTPSACQKEEKANLIVNNVNKYSSHIKYYTVLFTAIVLELCKCCGHTPLHS